MHGKYARFHWLLNINQVNPRIPFLTLLVSGLVSAVLTCEELIGCNDLTEMSKWRDKAFEVFPELIDQFEDADTPYLLWFVLRDAFDHAYEQKPRNESLIRRIYNYSDWCCDQPRGDTAKDDLLTCVAVCFYEHIPSNAEAREDMPRWWRAEDMASEPSVFQYNLSESEFSELKSFLSRESHRYDASLRGAI